MRLINKQNKERRKLRDSLSFVSPFLPIMKTVCFGHIYDSSELKTRTLATLLLNVIKKCTLNLQNLRNYYVGIVSNIWAKCTTHK